MRWLIVKQKESLNEYSYATYIYNIIADDFFYHGYPIIELIEEDKFIPQQDVSDILYVLNAPDSKEMLIKLWYSVTLPKIVKRLQADKIIYLNGMLGPYKLIRQPQVMLLFGMDYFVNPKIANKWQQLSLKRLAKNVEHATLSFTYSHSAINTLTTVLSDTLACHIKTIHPTPRAVFRTLTWKEKEAAKEKYAAGNEYFLLKSSSCNASEIILYLRAFSYFKKWQKSAMKLVLLVSEEITEDEDFKNTFSSYVFRNDVFFIGEMQRGDYHLLLGAAYGFLMLTGRDSDLLYIVESLQCSTPVLTYDSPSVKELAEDAPYFLLGKSFTDIAQGMIAMYKSERMRATHIEKGLEIAGRDFNYEATKEQLLSLLNNM